MKNHLLHIGKLLLIVSVCLSESLCAQSKTNAVSDKQVPKSMSFIVLGDLHYDKLEDHDMDWLATKPGDLKQVTSTYVPNTENNWTDFMATLAAKAQKTPYKTMGILQLGDLSEGLAGNPDKALQMAGSAINAVKSSNVGVPWILTKGNHDITGPGAKEAFVQIYTPYIKAQTGIEDIKNATYSYRVGDAQFVAIDLWDSETDPVAFCRKAFESSDAKYKFVTTHEPVIPVTERCWHFFRKENEAGKREQLLEVLAKNKVIVLCAHLHRYSVVKRETQYGPIVQIMATSVIGNKRNMTPKYSLTLSDYGAALVDRVPQYEPKTAQARRDMLQEEAKYISYYTMCDLPGYGVLSVDDKKGVSLEYYPAFGSAPYDSLNITQLQNKK